jgi:N-acetylmuramoyl-L-alanine amidase
MIPCRTYRMTFYAAWKTLLDVFLKLLTGRINSRAGCLFVLVFGTLSSSVRAGTIILDAGHGGHDPGGIAGQRYSEKTAALDVARSVQSRLRASGHRVIMTRNSDTFVELSRRVAISNRSPGNSIFVSIHFNASPNRDASGIETYFYSQHSARLAETVHNRVVAASRGEDRGVRRARFYVLRYNRRPSILVELGFLTNPAEGARIYKSFKYRQSLAFAVADGIRAALRP